MRTGASLHVVSVLAVAAAAAFGACTEHDAELDRTGGPLPNYDAGHDASSCQLPGPSTVDAQIPCEVDAVLEAKCRRCHTEPQQNGAPFPLLTWKDTQVDYFGTPIWVRMAEAVASGFMPLCAENSCGNFVPPVEKLTEGEKTTLLSWLECPQPSFGIACGD